ncbi:MAG: DUF4249 domain-containing protein [Chitinophagaceae bacterium]
MKKRALLYHLLIVFSLGVSCREKYLPPVIDNSVSYLVVDGTIINGPDSTLIRLSKTKKLQEDPTTGGLTNASVTLEDIEGATIYNLYQLNNNGVYGVGGMSLDLNKKYKLRINTADGGRYLSDELTVTDTPPIDSLNWQKKDDGVTIYVNTHDPSAKTNYYRWEYVETYDYRVNNYSIIKYRQSPYPDSSFVDRTPAEQIYHCWKTANSTTVFLSSTLNLKEDIVNLVPLRFIPTAAIELSSQYSILAKQFALTRQAFEYMLNLKRISEQMGSLFDVQPSEIAGNIHNVDNPDEPVVGFVAASSLQQKRIFITRAQVNPWNYSYYCSVPKIVPMDLDSIRTYFGGPSPYLIPIDRIIDLRTGKTTDVHGGEPLCVDCQSHGGTTSQPDFWQ